MMTTTAIIEELKIGCSYYLVNPILTKNNTGSYPHRYVLTKDSLMLPLDEIWLMEWDYSSIKYWFKTKQIIKNQKPDAVKYYINNKDSSCF